MCVCACAYVCVFAFVCDLFSFHADSVADAAHGHVRGDLVQLCKEGNTKM